MAQPKFWLCAYQKEGDTLLHEFPVHTNLAKLQELFNKDELVDCYPICSEEQAAYFQQQLLLPLDFQRMEYFLERRAD